MEKLYTSAPTVFLYLSIRKNSCHCLKIKNKTFVCLFIPQFISVVNVIINNNEIREQVQVHNNNNKQTNKNRTNVILNNPKLDYHIT